MNIGNFLDRADNLIETATRTPLRRVLLELGSVAAIGVGTALGSSEPTIGATLDVLGGSFGTLAVLKAIEGLRNTDAGQQG